MVLHDCIPLANVAEHTPRVGEVRGDDVEEEEVEARAGRTMCACVAHIGWCDGLGDGVLDVEVV